MSSSERTRREFVVRPELADSTLRLLAEEAERFELYAEHADLTAALSSCREAIRAGMPFDLLACPDGYTSMGRELECAVLSRFEPISETAGEPEWSYLSDLAALAADIEAAFEPVAA